MLRPGMELLLFRLGDRGYACPRERVREVIDVGTGQPAVPGLPSSSLGALGGTWLVIDRDAIRLPAALTTR